MKKAFLYSRVSSAIQSERGEGIARQIENAKAFLKNFPEYIIANDVFTDTKSGFNGANLDESAGLGTFIKSAEQGNIPRDSLLVIEAPDRLSRLGIKKGQKIFDRIMACGIDIALVRFGIILRHGDENDFTGSLIVSVGLYLGNLESAQKSERIRFTLNRHKQESIKGGRKYSGKVPSWLELAEDKMSFGFVPDQVEAVKLMFNMRAKGASFGKIEAELNKQGFKPVKKKKETRWYEATVARILKYRQVIGEQQVHEMQTIDGKKKRVPIGDPIKNYYPPIIEEDLFYKVQASFREKRTGRIAQFKNLFSYLTKCECGSSRSYAKPNKTAYLRCRDYIAKPRLCNHESLYYEPVEKVLLQAFRMLDYSKLNDSYDGKALIALQSKVEKSQQSIDTLASSIDSFDNPDSLVGLLPKLATRQTNHNLLLEDLAKLQNEVPIATGSAKDLAVETEEERMIFNNFISQHVKNIVVMDKQLEIHFKHRKSITLSYSKHETSESLEMLGDITERFNNNNGDFRLRGVKTYFADPSATAQIILEEIEK